MTQTRNPLTNYKTDILYFPHDNFFVARRTLISQIKKDEMTGKVSKIQQNDKSKIIAY